MTLSAHPQTPLPLGQLLGATLLGYILVTAGLLAGYLTIATPFVSTLVPGAPSAGGSIGIGVGVWSLALIAGGALLVAGTSRLARLVAAVRRGSARGGPAARALASAGPDIAVVSNVALPEGHPIPELVIGAFGAAIVHELPPSKLVGRGANGWEARTGDSWQPTIDPLEAAARDADRVRRWISLADLDFVVRVYAAVIIGDQAVHRTPTCAAITGEQLPGWIASLPRQRTLSPGRRDRLLALAQRPATAEVRPRGRDW